MPFRTSKAHRSFAIASIFLSTACKNGQQGASVSVSNGTAATDENSAGVRGFTVALGDASGVRCTGFLVAPTVVVTAAHCTYEKIERAYTGSVISAGSPSARIVSQTMHPTYVKERNSRTTVKSGDGTGVGEASVVGGEDTHDVAVLRLESAIPGSTSVATFSRSALTLAKGVPMMIIGYGKEDALKGTTGTLRYGEVLFETFIGPVEFSTSRGPTKALTEKGDSGGPIFAKSALGRWVVAGVTSRGNLVGDEPGDSILSDVSKFKDWIEQTGGVELQIEPATPAEKHAVPGKKKDLAKDIQSATTPEQPEAGPAHETAPRTNPEPGKAQSLREVFASWGETPIDCGPGVVEVFSHNETLCMRARQDIPAGMYTYSGDGFLDPFFM